MPLIQIDLIDRNGLLAVYVRNNGIGPYIIKRLEFVQNGRSHASIEDCLTLDAKTYQFIPVTEQTSKIILPNDFFNLFSLQRGILDTDEDISDVRRQLAPLKIKVEGCDLYNKKIIVERDLEWFLKYHAI